MAGLLDPVLPPNSRGDGGRAHLVLGTRLVSDKGDLCGLDY
ncbi:hypothetical protein MUK42_36358 [Musa troglodytarum]|uniref:Uncharacterized protein n=1 Tax=Musa troglodytarum TaxID=320322 RepID=A0A9E7HD46_9LILI|nr:hypothetical protein MUK42_36358 [Musa troglodytarum]